MTTQSEVYTKILDGTAKQVFQLKSGDIVEVPKGKKYVKETVLSTEIDKGDHRITHVTTKSGTFDSYSYGYL